MSKLFDVFSVPNFAKKSRSCWFLLFLRSALSRDIVTYSTSLLFTVKKSKEHKSDEKYQRKSDNFLASHVVCSFRFPSLNLDSSHFPL